MSRPNQLRLRTSRPLVSTALPTAPDTDPSGPIVNTTGISSLRGRRDTIVRLAYQVPTISAGGGPLRVIRGGMPNISLAQSKTKTARATHRKVKSILRRGAVAGVTGASGGGGLRSRDQHRRWSKPVAAGIEYG